MNAPDAGVSRALRDESAREKSALLERALATTQAGAEPGRSQSARLQEATGLGAADFVAALATLTGIGAIGMAEMERHAPAFDLLPWADAQIREVLLLRDGAALRAVIADPFNFTRRGWLEERAGPRTTSGGECLQSA